MNTPIKACLGCKELTCCDGYARAMARVREMIDEQIAIYQAEIDREVCNSTVCDSLAAKRALFALKANLSDPSDDTEAP